VANVDEMQSQLKRRKRQAKKDKFQEKQEAKGDEVEEMEQATEAKPQNSTPQKDAHEPEQLNPFGEENGKYWAQRYRLFSRFDEGILMDKGSLFAKRT
jgi:hypothetical protein